MGFKEISLKLPTDYNEQLIEKRIGQELRIRNFTYQISNKSLDARNKKRIHWLLRVGVVSEEIKGEEFQPKPTLEIPYKKRDEKALVVGSGPAGFFAALALQKAGFKTTLIERGTKVQKRAQGIEHFESTGEFDPKSNYAFGEGGAGTFSDGKLTSRSKHISKEKQFILSSYIAAGAPEEIAYMAHPHVGSDNLKIVVKNLRDEFENLGGTMLFETSLNDLKIQKGKVTAVVTSQGVIEAQYFVLATGHSAYETYRMLIKNGIPFRTKNFAIGGRIEHHQELINRAQWGQEKLPGIKAAEYRLTSPGDGNLPVYTFCMCPGGVVVPATAYSNTNIVNGMSLYKRNNKFANAASVAGVHPNELLGKEANPMEVLDWIEQLEQSFYNYSNGFEAPFCSIQDFIDKKQRSKIEESSYPLGLKAAPLWEMLPQSVSNAIRAGFKDFSRKIRGFETGNMIGLESKTSAPIQVLRDKTGLCEGFENLYITGEGSGYAGGIISSGADGLKAAMNIIGKHE